MEDFFGTAGTVALVLLVALCVVALVLLVVMVRRYRLVRRPETPLPTKIAYWSSIVYTVVPVDLLPDPIYLDDIGVLLGALLYVGRSLRKVHGRKAADP